jgi:transposase InsO family protein
VKQDRQARGETAPAGLGEDERAELARLRRENAELAMERDDAPTIKVEYIHRHRFCTRAEARLKIATWIVDFYNTRRRHSACDGLSPIDYERLMAEARRADAA